MLCFCRQDGAPRLAHGDRRRERNMKHLMRARLYLPAIYLVVATLLIAA
jgi:hypothetical protein